MKKHKALLHLATGMLTIWAGSAFSSYTNVVNGTTNILVGSFLIQDLGTMPYINPVETFRATNAASWAGLKTRIDGTPGQAQTKGAVEGSLSFLAGHTIGSDTYDGIDINVFSGNNVWNDLVRFGGVDQGGLMLWDFDLSSYLAGKAIGPIPGQSTFQIKMDYGNRRISGSPLDAPFYLSYNDGAGLTLDTTVTTNLTPAPRLVHGILTNTAHFVQVGAVPAGPPASGVVTFDITDHILASTDKVFRVAGFITEFRGDINILNDSGIIEVIVDPEKAPPYINEVSLSSGGDLTYTFYSTTNRTYALESATDLVAQNWTPIPGYTNFQGGQVSISITNPVSGAAEAIRVVGLPPKTLFPLEDFESGAANWVPDGGGVWQLGAPSFGATNAISGTQVYGTVLAGPYPENRTAGLRSPVIDLTTANRATLLYWEYLYLESNDSTQVFVRDASGNPLAAPLDLPIVDVTGSNAEIPWAERITSLPPEALGQQITLEFRLNSDIFDAFAGWYIDDVLILEQ